ncbi:adenylyl-sulfate kinase [Chitinophaga nivalis]|uniref:Adenylyl-sulfate kinase n=1 Tax=Chitinophaga nivalis TaxID=2991709 RepID=A0ABT3II63_9BACT|nr:adenylyl-sulfate kinase [Chitinophaga nivalis]MCW3466649.1 adenylyl-sulfate kinase [Chitinophaga nivalis]MCW3483660.1 adenylyl-sulfate kinase [Chitinophaga nivalis]
MKNEIVLWLVGIPSSGKTTIAHYLKAQFSLLHYYCVILDGDDIRCSVNRDLGFSPEDRSENIRRAAAIAKIISSAGVLTICSFISPLREMRQIARSIIGDKLFIEIHVNCALAVCINRDVKGLYQKAIAGEIDNLTGYNADFETPLYPFLVVNTDAETVEESGNKILQALSHIIQNRPVSPKDF